MLSFERHGPKDVQVVNIYKDADSTKPHGEIYYVSRHKGKSLIDHDDHRSVLAGDELFLKKKFTLSETEYAHLLKLAVDNSELDADTIQSIKRAYLEIRTRLQSKMRREIVFDETDALHLRINYDTTKPKTNIALFSGAAAREKVMGSAR